MQEIQGFYDVSAQWTAVKANRRRAAAHRYAKLLQIKLNAVSVTLESTVFC